MRFERGGSGFTSVNPATGTGWMPEAATRAARRAASSARREGVILHSIKVLTKRIAAIPQVQRMTAMFMCWYEPTSA